VADHAITFARSARKELEAFDAHIVKRIVPKIESLASEPRPEGCRKLKGEKNRFFRN
jgi:mRNA interferase RelE/StbE